MANALSIADALKRELRARKLTYSDVAGKLGISAAHVKRLFADRDFTLERIDQICSLIGIEFSELSRTIDRHDQLITQLTPEQEAEIARDHRLLVAAVCALGNWTFERIIEIYQFNEAELVALLARLDRLKLIELLPNNRIRPLIARAFTWIPNGPIQRLFNAEVARDYLDSPFDDSGDLLLLVNGMLSAESRNALQAKLRQVANEMRELHHDDIPLPFAQRMGTSMLLAIRTWEPRLMRALRRSGSGSSSREARTKEPARKFPR